MAEFRHSRRWSLGGRGINSAVCRPHRSAGQGEIFLVCFNSHIGSVPLKCTSKCARKAECVALTGEGENPILQNVLPLVLHGRGTTKPLCQRHGTKDLRFSANILSGLDCNRMGKPGLTSGKWEICLCLQLILQTPSSIFVLSWMVWRVFWNGC